MTKRIFTVIAVIAFGSMLAATLAYSQSPDWFLLPPDQPGGGAAASGGAAAAGRGAGRGGGRGAGMPACADDIAKYCAGQNGLGAQACLRENSDRLSGACSAQLAAIPVPDNGGVVPCSRSIVCVSRVAGGGSGAKGRVEWKTTLGYTFTYPFTDLPPGGGGVSAVDLDSKGNLWAFQRNQPGQPQLFKFGPDHKLLFAVSEDVLKHQYKAHGIKVDAQDNVWICDADGATITEVSPEGKVLLTLGVRGHRGDWNEAKGQRLLWQPLMLSFTPSGDMYIFEGHANESPNDVDSGDPTNNIGAARVIHLDKNLRFVHQWYGNAGGPGKFTQTHGSTVDPATGNVWIGDREEYRIVVYTGDGKFIRTLQTKNLICALYFDPHGQLWMGSGQDSQILKLDRDANVIGAIGNGPGRGDGQFIESSYLTMDPRGHIFSGDTSVGRITEFIPKGK